jgi:ADP-ribose pyrophosphatase YjhB (NUDIX family)/ribosomal protein S18 acetylase RimI-like enzyme
MPIPPFITHLREKVGTDLLWLTGVTALVLDDEGRVLLGHRADTEKWALISGILEPGEEPAVAMVREIKEETGVDAVVDALAAIQVQEPMAYGNGDRAQYLDLLYLAHATGGEPHVADDESLAVGWFAVDELPEDTGHYTQERLAAVAEYRANPAAGPRFTRPPATPDPPTTHAHDTTVRIATPADAGTVGRLLHDFNVEFESPTPSAADFTRRFTSLLEGPNVVVLLAERNSRPVGFAYLTLRPSPYYDGPLAQLEELYVVPELRDQGIGSALLTTAVDRFRAQGVGEIHINVDEIDTDTRRFYERHGFTNIEPGEDYRMLCYIRELDT